MRSLSLFLLPVLLLAQPARRPLELRSPLQDKIFSVLSALERAPAKDPRLDEIAARKRAALQQPGNPIEAMRWTPEEIATVSAVLAGAHHLDAELRATGLYQKEPVLVSAWESAAAGMNRIYDVYGLGKPPRYPAIDSVSFDVKSPNYARMLEVIRAVMKNLMATPCSSKPPSASRSNCCGRTGGTRPDASSPWSAAKTRRPLPASGRPIGAVTATPPSSSPAPAPTGPDKPCRPGARRG